MADGRSRPYAIDSDTECDRLERQAEIADIADHLRYARVPPRATVLDAGCGSGSMARLFASRYADSGIIGIDLRSNYITYARERAAYEGLGNVTFETADILHLPFPNGAFDVVWSKYVLQWLDHPQAAIAELRRVTKPGGQVLCCNFDGFAVTNWPEDPQVQPHLDRVFPALVDPFIGRKMAPMFREAGLTEITVAIEADHLYTVIGAIDPPRRQNWVEQHTAARLYVAQVVGSEQEAAAFAEAHLAYMDRADTCSYTALYFVSGAPGLA
jgi:ubiquinone/menaquinone biosynthesis C-methylase UbiE